MKKIVTFNHGYTADIQLIVESVVEAVKIFCDSLRHYALANFFLFGKERKCWRG